MSSKKAKFTKQEKLAARARLQIYHEGLTDSDLKNRIETNFTMMVLMVTSPWWLAIEATRRNDIIHLMMSYVDKDKALDVLYGK